MPNWKIHIEVAKRLNETLQYQGDDYQLFLFGNILPDVNNCFIVTDISKKISHRETHYSDGPDEEHVNFYKLYQDKILTNPLLCGYYIHLYTDYYWNHDFMKRIGETNLSYDELRRIKQQDFRAYNDEYAHNIIEDSNTELILKYAKELNRVSITEDDITHVIEFLKTQKKCHVKLQVYTKEQLDTLLMETVEIARQLWQDTKYDV